MGVEVEKSLDDLYERVAGFEEFGERLDSLEAQGEQIHDMLVEVLSCLNREHYSSGSRSLIGWLWGDCEMQFTFADASVSELPLLAFLAGTAQLACPPEDSCLLNTTSEAAQEPALVLCSLPTDEEATWMLLSHAILGQLRAQLSFHRCARGVSVKADRGGHLSNALPLRMWRTQRKERLCQ